MRLILTDRVAWSVGLSVCRSACHTSEPCENGCTDRAAVWVEDFSGPGELRIRWGSRSPRGKGQILGENGVPLQSIWKLYGLKLLWPLVTVGINSKSFPGQQTLYMERRH